MSAGRVWATAGFLLGISLSVAANVAHARQEAGPQIAGAAFPVVLLVTVEILARVAWPDTWSWSAARYGGAGVVALVAAVVSYGHMAALLASYGEDALTAAIGPLAIDGLMVVSSMALLAIGRNRGSEPVPETVPPMPWVQVDRPVWWPAAVTAPEPVETGGSGPVPIAGPQVAAGAEVREDVDQGPADPELEALVESARNRFREQLEAGSVPSMRTLRRELRVGHPRAAKVREALSAPETSNGR